MEVELYIKRSITDIARKCHVSDIDVIEAFKSLIGKLDNKH